jgi:hypothetical protein
MLLRLQGPALRNEVCLVKRKEQAAVQPGRQGLAGSSAGLSYLNSAKAGRTVRPGDHRAGRVKFNPNQKTCTSDEKEQG